MMFNFFQTSRLFFSVVLIAAVACLLNTSPAVAETLLRLKFTEGEKLDYEYCQKMNSKMVVEGSPMSSKIQSTMDFSRRVKSVDAQGKATIEITINRVQMSMTMPMGQSLQYDSAAEKQESEEGMGKTIAEQLGTIINKPIELKIDPLGNVSDIKMPADIEQEKAANIICSEENIRQMLGGITLPEEAVAKGKTWTSSLSIPVAPGMGTGTMEQTFKYQGPVSENDAELEKIDLTAEVTMKPAEGSPVKLTLRDQDTHGEILFDNKAGRLQSTKSTCKITFELEVMGNAMSNSMETVIELKLMPDGSIK